MSDDKERTPPDGGYAARMAAAGIETERDERGHYKVPMRPVNPADLCPCPYARCEHDNRKVGQ